MIKQLLPNSSSGSLFNHLQFQQEKQNLVDRLQKNYGRSPCFEIYDFNPYPLLLSTCLLRQIKDLHDLLIKAIDRVVTDCFNNPDILDKLSLSENVLRLLHRCQHIPYQIGAVRPDFLFDIHDQIKICEINARFPVNVFVLTEYLHREMSEYCKRWPSFTIKPHPIESMAALVDFFDITKPVNILLQQEKSGEIYLLRDHLKQIDHRNIDVFTPMEYYELKRSSKKDLEEQSQLILNLKQEEILEMDEASLDRIIRSTFFNDLRTVFLVHDKQLLAVLADKTIMSKYMTDHECDRLEKYLVPTYSIKDIRVFHADINSEPWVFKKRRSGKGEGMYLSSTIDSDSFKKIVCARNSEYIAQPFVQQTQFELICSTGIDRKPNYDSVYLVGSIPSFNAQYLGPGLFRGSNKTIINASSGASFFTPLYTD